MKLYYFFYIFFNLIIQLVMCNWFIFLEFFFVDLMYSFALDYKDNT